MRSTSFAIVSPGDAGRHQANSTSPRPWRGMAAALGRSLLATCWKCPIFGRNGARFVLRSTRHLAYACNNERISRSRGWSSVDFRSHFAAVVPLIYGHGRPTVISPRGEGGAFCVFGLANRREVMSITRRRILKSTGGGLAGVLASGVAPYGFVRNIVKAAESDTIKVGILHSLSGTIAIIESSLHNAELLAIEEINAKGGVLGKKLQPVVEDPQSLVQVFAEKAKKLLLDDKVVAVLGCYTSASRQSVLPVFEENNGVLLYPTLYEAQECSKNCFYTGAVPNQQLDDFVPWILKTLGRKKFYLIGANYIYPKETNREVKALLQKHGGTTVAEEYSPLGSTEFSTNINKIASSGADIVFSDLVGDQIVAFYKQFREFGITAKDIPICTPITTEQEIAAMGAENAVGHYTSFNYFQSVDTPQNKSFVDRYKAKYGKDAVTNAVMEAAYFQTYFLAQAIAKVKSTDADALIFEGLPGQEFQAPQGKVKIDEKNHHTWLWARIGQANEKGQFDVVWKSEDWIRPQPWVPYLYPNKSCDFTDKRVLDRVKKPWSAEKNRSGTIDL
jgi:urea transport system substrate-binding protein